MHRRVLLAFFGLAALASGLHASGFLLFQHGGRATGQVGAFTARAEGPMALAYNPAAVARLEGVQIQGGLDFTAPRDDYRSISGGFAQDHLISAAPAAYATWHLPEDYYPWAFGLGFDSRAWYLADWTPALFPGRFLTNRQEIVVYALHPVVAYQLSERWSLGAGLRYEAGTLEEGNNAVLVVPGTAGLEHDVEVARTASADVDGIGFDLGLHYGADAWGWGLVLDGGNEIEGNGEVGYAARDVPADPVLEDNLARLTASGSTRQSLELPWELRTGFWVAPYPELRVELDLAWTGWSVVDETAISYRPNPFAESAQGAREVRARDWEDTLSVRLAVEGEVAENWLLFGGAALEPSPVPAATLEPGFARGDALVFGLGFAYQLDRASFELGWSYLLYDDRDARGQELARPAVRGTYETQEQRFAFSIGWRR
jgi:long-chain fatty acid transport protein